MKPIIVADSSCDLNDVLAKEIAIQRVPFALTSNGHHYVDDETMDIKAFLADIDASEEVTQSAAMSPQHFINAVGDAEEAFLITITGRLSSTYNNACMAAREMREAGKKVHVFDSQAASAGETSYMFRIHQAIEAGMTFEEIAAKEAEIAQTNYTYFILNNYSTLTKSGRLPRIAGNILTSLSICPVCRGVNGEIGLKSIARGMDKGVKRLAQHIAAEAVDFSQRTLFITHIDDPERAEQVKAEILKLSPFPRVEIMAGTGLNTCYANRGGIIIGF